MEWWYQSAEERMSAPTVYPPPPPPPPPKVKKIFSLSWLTLFYVRTHVYTGVWCPILSN